MEVSLAQEKIISLLKIFCTNIKNINKFHNIQIKIMFKSNGPASLLEFRMKQRTLKNVNNYFNTNMHSYLETSGSQSFNLYLKVVHFFNTSVN